MSPMDVEPAELCELLAGHHVVLDDVAQHILAVRCWGGSNAAAGELLGYSEGRIRARFERVEDIVLGPSGSLWDATLSRASTGSTCPAKAGARCNTRRGPRLAPPSLA